MPYIAYLLSIVHISDNAMKVLKMLRFLWFTSTLNSSHLSDPYRHVKVRIQQKQLWNLVLEVYHDFVVLKILDLWPMGEPLCTVQSKPLMNYRECVGERNYIAFKNGVSLFETSLYIGINDK